VSQGDRKLPIGLQAALALGLASISPAQHILRITVQLGELARNVSLAELGELRREDCEAIERSLIDLRELINLALRDIRRIE